jgi:hypothetical protein
MLFWHWGRPDVHTLKRRGEKLVGGYGGRKGRDILSSVDALGLEVASAVTVACSSAGASSPPSAPWSGATPTPITSPSPSALSNPPAIRIGNHRCVNAGATPDIRSYKSSRCERILSPAKSRYLNLSNSAVSPPDHPKTTSHPPPHETAQRTAPSASASASSGSSKLISLGPDVQG